MSIEFLPTNYQQLSNWQPIDSMEVTKGFMSFKVQACCFMHNAH
jgi:hypothetical protein